MVNSTLISLYKKPSYYNDTFFDCKMNYLINIQNINMPNYQIIDYASGFQGSYHNNTCFKTTQLSQKYNELLDKDKWC